MENAKTLLSYYEQNKFNPVYIDVEDQEKWQSHFLKRSNLYNNHLGVPLSLLKGVRLIEYGCNSGENALVFGLHGAKLTLVEPNENVHPRLKQLFGQFGLTELIEELSTAGITDYDSTTRFDLAVAEGFLFALDDRDEALAKVVEIIRPGGLGIISFNDRIGCMIEVTKRALLARCCQLAGVDRQSDESTGLAYQLFGEDFKRLNASRSFKAWWKDTLVNPFLDYDKLWSYQEIVPQLAEQGCEILGTSPVWMTSHTFNWYKNAVDSHTRLDHFFDDLKTAFPYLLTGYKPQSKQYRQPEDSLVNTVLTFIEQLSSFAELRQTEFSLISYPEQLTEYVRSLEDRRFDDFFDQFNDLIRLMKEAEQVSDLLIGYSNKSHIRNAWGSPYHYFSFIKASY